MGVKSDLTQTECRGRKQQPRLARSRGSCHLQRRRNPNVMFHARNNVRAGSDTNAASIVRIAFEITRTGHACDGRIFVLSYA